MRALFLVVFLSGTALGIIFFAAIGSVERLGMKDVLMMAAGGGFFMLACLLCYRLLVKNILPDLERKIGPDKNADEQ